MAKRRKNRQKKPAKKQAWIQCTGQWRTHIFISTGFSGKDIVRFAQRKFIKDGAKAIASKEKEFQEMINQDCAFTHCFPNGTIVLRLREYEDTWVFWQTLVHELSHTVDFISEHLGFQKEQEARAYLDEFLFKQIRKKLQGHMPKSVTD